MASTIFNFLAETFIHPGTGQNEGAIDLPVAREAATDYPYVPGSGLKGALRDAARMVWRDVNQEVDEESAGENHGEPTDPGASEQEENELNERPKQPAPEVLELFGASDNAGELLVSDLRLLLLPVRCLTASYRWLTCPHLLERFQRDTRRAVGKVPDWELPTSIAAGHYLGAGADQLQLEERSFDRGAAVDPTLVQGLSQQVPDEQAAQRLDERLVIVNDNDFAWFARYGLPVQARNALEEGTKQSKSLWFEESLPPDTLMYALISTRRDAGSLTKLTSIFCDEGTPYLRVGANETVGQGWFRVGWRATGDRDQ